MPKIERFICMRYQGVVYQLNNCCASDKDAVRQAVFSLEKRLGKMRGGLQKYFRENTGEIWGVLK